MPGKSTNTANSSKTSKGQSKQAYRNKRASQQELPVMAAQILPEALSNEQARRNADKIKYNAVDMFGVSLITGLLVLVFCMFAWR